MIHKTFYRFMAQAAKTRAIQRVVPAIEQYEGVGARVRRSIGNEEVKNFTPFLMFDHFQSSGDAGFPEHPHAGQETITYCLQGSIAHEDFLGNQGMLYPGDLQFMTAGKAIVHSEMPVEGKDGTPAVLLQLWVDLPEELKDCPPRYRDLREWEIPKVNEQDGKLQIKVVSGKSHGVESAKDLAYTPVEYYHFILKKGAKFEQELRPEFNYFLYNMKGNGLELNGNQRVKEYENVFFKSDGGNVMTGEHVGEENDTTEFLLVGGQKLDQTIVQYGPFISTSLAGIKHKVKDFQKSRNGFEQYKGWKTLISEGVTEEMINGPLKGSMEERERARNAYLKNKL
ncbi:hypothetical protein DICA3_E10154 [Diutina catenulata]